MTFELHLFLAKYGGFVITKASLYDGGSASVSLYEISSRFGSISYAFQLSCPTHSKRSPLPANGSITLPEGLSNPSMIYEWFTV